MMVVMKAKKKDILTVESLEEIKVEGMVVVMAGRMEI